MKDDHDKNNSLEENKILAQRFIELIWNKGRFNLAKQLVCRDFSYHVSLINQTLEYDHVVNVMQMVRSSMEDFEVSIEDIVAEDDRVVTQSSFCGTLIKPILGFQPSANIITFSAVSFWQMKKGKVQSVNTLLDTAELMRQISRDNSKLEVGIERLKPS